MKVKCFCCKIQIKTPQPVIWTTHPSIVWTYQPNGSAFHLCVENVCERSFNVRTEASSTMLIIATQRCIVEMGGTNNSKTLVSDVQESQEKASVFCRRKIFMIRRLSAQMVQIYVSSMAHSLVHQNRFVTAISTVFLVLMTFCVPINQSPKHLLVMRGQDVPQVRCIPIVLLNVWPWTRFCATFQKVLSSRAAIQWFHAVLGHTSEKPQLHLCTCHTMRQRPEC